MIALGVALGRRRDDTGQPVGTGGRTQNGTPNGVRFVENTTAPQILVASAISQCAEHAGNAKPADGVEHVAARRVDECDGILRRQNGCAGQQRPADQAVPLGI